MTEMDYKNRYGIGKKINVWHTLCNIKRDEQANILALLEACICKVRDINVSKSDYVCMYFVYIYAHFIYGVCTFTATSIHF